MTKWDERFMELARHVAQWSKDPRTKVGAVIVGVDRRNIAFGYNGFPRGVEDSAEWLNDRAIKNALIQHAERNAFDNAHFDLKGSTLYVTRFPCHECMKTIANRGIVKIFSPPEPNDPAWAESCKWSWMIIQEAGLSWEEAS